MLRIANEERPWVEILPTQGATIGKLTLSMQQYPVQQGTLFTINYHNELGRVWIAEQCWQRWCEGLIGTANRSVIDPELLYGIAEWGLAPLLQASDATLCQNEPPTSCSNLPHQLALHIKWTVEEHEFHSIIFTWPTGFLRNIVGELSAERQQIYPAPPVVVPVYLGWCQLTLIELESIEIGMGVRIHCFGDIRLGFFAIQLPGGIYARVLLTEDNTMKFDELVQDIETLLASGSPMSKSDGTSSVELEQIPQQVLFEIGRASLEIGQLRQLKTGDVLPVGGCFAPEVTIRVNDRIIGQGELIACGNEFMVRITRWYLCKNTA
ncbi:TPA: SPI-2 type III secretion system cytoplasmic ring protein SsaQ [Salmonella enterica subsp. enterica serovar Concord]|uniref:SPI-2 type III secretion system cytoplasmic ring protein SsaQ n=1 Tax=Salmonella enterica TaxID=28901 RepID=UPI000DEC8127|nr:SPI-2 type III secretion system cytoplasmic ring protein SsaQ [Salmonella enterica]HDJ1983104.1 SPI-2 type III secretion system cytoplasmic ring protein SsaQ [Salmonella enterica subsp. enterica serovar Concord]AXD19541.1 SPI-2 type III secretion system apparatus protein SsaQ [Salmonella enterica]EBF7252364.1 SPI-2 type III secretion system apparatus protein SsaQ [Salmonella enterica]HDO8214061.1 SPI-2 type III secretion system cytoplasmic ring protein SsaQ [Salmonella enterica subsp. enteri